MLTEQDACDCCRQLKNELDAARMEHQSEISQLETASKQAADRLRAESQMAEWRFHEATLYRDILTKIRYANEFCPLCGLMNHATDCELMVALDRYCDRENMGSAQNPCHVTSERYQCQRNRTLIPGGNDNVQMCK